VTVATAPRLIDPPPDSTTGQKSRSRSSAGTVPQPAWLVGYRARLLACDIVAVGIAVCAAHVIRLDSGFGVSVGVPAESFAWLYSLLLIVTWLLSLAVEGLWDSWVLGTRSAEVPRILVASLVEFSVVGIIGYLTLADLARSYLVIAAPLGIVGLLVSHGFWRRRLISQRLSGSHQRGLIIVGELSAVAAM